MREMFRQIWAAVALAFKSLERVFNTVDIVTSIAEDEVKQFAIDSAAERAKRNETLALPPAT